MEKINFDEIDNARKVLGLGEKSTLKEIKNAYRKKAKEYHPDSAGHARKAECDGVMKKINGAYEILMNYCENYVYSLKKEDVEPEKDAYEKYMKGFENDWLWGKGAGKN